MVTGTASVTCGRLSTSRRFSQNEELSASADAQVRMQESDPEQQSESLRACSRCAKVWRGHHRLRSPPPCRTDCAPYHRQRRPTRGKTGVIYPVWVRLVFPELPAPHKSTAVDRTRPSRRSSSAARQGSCSSGLRHARHGSCRDRRREPGDLVVPSGIDAIYPRDFHRTGGERSIAARHVSRDHRAPAVILAPRKSGRHAPPVKAAEAAEAEIQAQDRGRQQVPTNQTPTTARPAIRRRARPCAQRNTRSPSRVTRRLTVGAPAPANVHRPRRLPTPPPPPPGT